MRPQSHVKSDSRQKYQQHDGVRRLRKVFVIDLVLFHLAFIQFDITFNRQYSWSNG